jgi:hypothetical protein
VSAAPLASEAHSGQLGSIAVPGEAGAAAWAMWLAGVTALSALVELVVLRIATRTAVHIPGLDEVAQVYRVVADAGRLGYYVAAVLLTAALVAMVLALFGRGHRAASTAVGVTAVGAAASRAGWLSTDALDAMVVVGVVVLAAGIARRLLGWERLPIVLYAAAFALAGQPVVFAGALAVAGEAAALAAMICLAVLALRRPDRLTGVVAVAVAVITLAAMLLSPSTARILLLWNAGLAGALPAVVYAVGFGGVAATIVRLWRAGRIGAVVGLGLLVEAGIGLHSSYQSGLAILGLAVLTVDLLDAGPTALPHRRAAATSSR